MNAVRPFQTFEDLEAYKAARGFRKAMYAVARGLPEIEKFNLTTQIRRAVLSLTNNIAEGHGEFHYPDQIKFMLQARGSLQELVDDLNTCEDEKYLSSPGLQDVRNQAWHVLKLLNGYLNFLRTQASSKSALLHEEAVEYSLNSETDVTHATM